MEKAFEVTDKQAFNEALEDEIMKMKSEHPNNHFKSYDDNEICDE